MSISYYITPYDPKAWEDPEDTSPKPTSDLRIYPGDFEEKLRQRWPGIQIFERRTMACAWWFPLPPEIVGNYSGAEGRLHPDCQVISLGRSYDDLFQGFLLWYRSYVPAKYRLWFSNSSSWDRLELTSNTTEADIVKFRREYRI